MSSTAEAVKWDEPLAMRWAIYGRAYAGYLLKAIAWWGGSWMGFALFVRWRMGDPPWSVRGITAGLVVGTCGVLVRLFMERSERIVRVGESGFTISHIGKRTYPLSAISDVRFEPVRDDVMRMELVATTRSGRKRKYVVGVGRRAARRAASFLQDSAEFSDLSKGPPAAPDAGNESSSDDRAKRAALVWQAWDRYFVVVGWFEIAMAAMCLVWSALLQNGNHAQLLRIVAFLIAVGGLMTMNFKSVRRK